MIRSISNAKQGVVCLLEGAKHGLEDGDVVVLNGVEGMNHNKNKGESINLTTHKITTINKNSFYIGDTSSYSQYIRNGTAKNIKLPINLQFKSLNQCLQNKQIPFDQLMSCHDYLKLNHQVILHIAFLALEKFKAKFVRMPKPWNLEDLDLFVQVIEENKFLGYYIDEKKIKLSEQDDKQIEYIIKRFCLTCNGSFAPLSAFFAGYVSQEIIKALTQKYMPTQQFLYTDCIEVLPDLPEKTQEWETAIKNLQILEQIDNHQGLRISIGNQLVQKIAQSNIFLIGAGAIGCELLKNFAMIGLGTAEATKTSKAGQITLTDPDVIEVSNLNRQFLFREKHLRKPKSSTAAASVIQMNPQLKGHIFARLDKVHDGTSNIFTDKFFEEQDIVANALDNVQARRYVDMRCVSAKTPLLESGTLGPKGHVQVIIPFKTESYGQQQDPMEDNEIPHCTLKMFPEETLHCVEWARDKFGKLFTIRPKSIAKIIEDPNYKPINSQDLQTLNEATNFLKKAPKSWEDCIYYARIKFQKYFVNDIKQLIHTYPLNSKTKEGNLFWTLPKRPPSATGFDGKNKLHQSFIAACACLRAVIFNIEIPDQNPRSDEFKQKLAQIAEKIQVPEFEPSEEKSKSIAQQVDKDPEQEEKKQQEADEEQKENQDLIQKSVSDFQAILKAFKMKKTQQMLIAQEFEKDNDKNFHIDFIYSMANCRSSNYKLEPMDWLTVKIKAGRIIPALATTTAAIAGLQTIELVKLIKNCKVDQMKNAFLNLAVPILQLSEPGSAPSIKIHDKLKITIWDRWDLRLPQQEKTNLKNIFDYIKDNYQLFVKNVFWKSQIIYMKQLFIGKNNEEQKLLNTPLMEIDSLNIDQNEDYVDLTLVYSLKEDGDIIENGPPIRVFFKK